MSSLLKRKLASNGVTAFAARQVLRNVPVTSHEALTSTLRGPSAVKFRSDPLSSMESGFGPSGVTGLQRRRAPG